MLLGVSVGLLVGALAGYFGGRIDDVLVKLHRDLPDAAELRAAGGAGGDRAAGDPDRHRGDRARDLADRRAAGARRIPRLAREGLRAAARALGYGHARIILREILPNALPPLIVTASVLVATAILMESALSFLGLSDPNVVSWGSMIGQGRELLRTAWYLSAVPGVAIVLTVLALNLLGDALNDALNPRVAAER